MTQDLLLSRILSGVVIIGDFYVKSPSRLDRYKIEVWAKEKRNELRFDEWFSNTEVENVLKLSGRLQKDYDKKITSINKQCEDRKYEMYKMPIWDKNVELFRKNLRVLESQVNEINRTRHSLDYLTLDGHLEGLKAKEIFKYGLRNKQGKRVQLDEEEIDRLYMALISAQIGVGEIRKLARSNEWRHYWQADNNNVFGKPVVDWTDEQRILVNFSRMYDNAFKHPDCPDDIIIEDDDRFDGWMIAQKRDRDKEDKDDKKGGEVFSFPNKIVTAQDEKGTYRTAVPITNEEELEEFRKSVDESNSYEAKQIKKQRQDALKKKGKVDEAELPDVRAKLNMAAQEMFKQKVLGK